MATGSRNKKKGSISVNFENTESSATIEEGDYLLEVGEVEQRESSTNNPMLVFTFQVAEGTFKGRKLFHNCSLQPQALFNLRGVLEALGNEVPQGVMELDIADLIGQTCGAHVIHELYEGKTKAKVGEFFPEEDLGEAETDQPPPKDKSQTAEGKTPTKKKKKAAIEVGSSVSFTDDEGNDLTGKVTEIADDAVTVKVGKEEWELNMDDLSLV